MKKIKGYKAFLEAKTTNEHDYTTENQFNASFSYIVTVKDNINVDDIAEELELKGCQIKKVHPYGVIVCNYDGNIDDLKTDDILSINADKIATTQK